jgi:PAS domain S-box-containing protein
VLINSAGAAVFGLPAEDIVGKDDTTLFREESTGAILSRDSAVMHSRERMTYESTSTVADGRTRMWQSTKGPWLDPEGNVLGIVGIARDVTDRKREEEAQRLLAAASGILASSLAFEATLPRLAKLVEPGFADACEIHVLEEGEIRRLTMPSPWETPAELMASVIADGVPRSMADLDPAASAALEARGLQSLLVVPIAARSEVVGCISFFSSDRDRYAQPVTLWFAQELGRRAGITLDVTRLYRKAEEVNRLKDEFLGIISHELRTPLTAILGWTNLLRRGLLPRDGNAKALETIERNAMAQARIIDDLMDTTRMVANNFQLEPEPLDLAHIVRTAIDAMRPVAAASGIRLTTDVGLVELPFYGDANRLLQALSNLLSNAFEFTPRGGTVEVGARVGEEATLWVKDDGEGMSASTLAHAFDRFRQGDSSTTRRHGGLGLGLSIVKYIIEAHGGTVTAESAGKGRGSKLTLKLPRAGAVIETMTPRAEENLPRLDGMLVLVVEDEPDTRELITRTFASVGAEVTAVKNVEEAVTALGRAAPRIIVSDIGMPGQDGYALMKYVRAESTTAIALTAYTSADHRSRALTAGYRTFMTKPVEPMELLAAAARLVLP